MAGRKDAAGWGGRRWTTLRKLVQWTALLAFVVLFVLSRRGGVAPWLANVPLRLDPLSMLAHLLASRTILASSGLALGTLALTLVFGRAWCGWLCPLGTLLDLFPLRRRQGRPAPPRDTWRGAKYALLLTILLAALLANLTLLVLDPLTILFRTLSVSVWPALDQLVRATESGLYQVPMLRPAVSAFDALLRPQVFPPSPVIYRYPLLYAAVLIGVISLNLVAPRFWCRSLCPLGAFLGLMSKVAVVRRAVSESCRRCDACARACPTGTIRPAKQYASDPGECTMCLTCLEACPHGAIAFPARLSVAGWNPYDPGRREALIALGATLAGIGLFRTGLGGAGAHPRLVRPPGAQPSDLFCRCVRCGECVRACPTGAIQPALVEAGVEGLWTPVLVPRIGYCDYACNACGQICPVQAIPALSLDDKRRQVIGSAYIDRDRCVAWADDQDCIVCEEMCPLPEKAVELEPVLLQGGEGPVVVQRPHVLRERCIGCGICEYKCPVDGEAAIRVAVPSVPGEEIERPLALTWVQSWATDAQPGGRISDRAR